MDKGINTWAVKDPVQVPWKSVGEAASPSRSLSWPPWDRFRIYLVYCLLIDVLFFLIYGGANWLTAQRALTFRMYWDWELAIPFVPGMVWAYGSMFVLFLFPLFQLREKELPVLGRQVLLATVVAGFMFLLLPGELGFPRTGDAGGYEAVFTFIYAVDLPHNLVPSLHITYSALIILSLMDVTVPQLRLIYGAWLLMIVASVLLVHQHHVADIAGSLVLVWICRRLVRQDRTSLSTGSIER